MAPTTDNVPSPETSQARSWDYAGWMLKSAPKSTDCDKEDTIGRRLGKWANSFRNHIKRHSDYKRRYFVLDHHDLRYYTGPSLDVYKGHIDLGTVTDVHESVIPDAPPFAIDLVTDARVFTLVPATKELMEEWKHRINQVIEQSRRRGMITRSLRTAVSGVSDGRSQRECEQQLPVFPKVSSHEACRTHPDRSEDGPSVKLSRLESSEVASTALLSTGTGTPATSRVRTASMSYTAHDPTTKPRRKLTRWEEITGNCPRWHMSIMRTQRLRHIPVFTPLAVPLDASSQQKSRSASLFRRSSLGPLTGGDGDGNQDGKRRESIFASIAHSIGLGGSVSRELDSPVNVPDNSKVDTTTVDWKVDSTPMWQKMFRRSASQKPPSVGVAFPKSDSSAGVRTSFVRDKDSHEYGRRHSQSIGADEHDDDASGKSKSPKLIRAISSRFSGRRSTLKRRQSGAGPMTADIASHLQRMRVGVMELQSSGLFFEPIELPTSFDIQDDTDNVGTTDKRISRSNPPEKYIYMAISRQERVKKMMAAIEDWNKKQQLLQDAVNAMSGVDGDDDNDQDLLRSVSGSSPILFPTAIDAENDRTSPTAELAAMQKLDLGASRQTAKSLPLAPLRTPRNRDEVLVVRGSALKRPHSHSIDCDTEPPGPPPRSPRWAPPSGGRSRLSSADGGKFFPSKTDVPPQPTTTELAGVSGKPPKKTLMRSSSLPRSNRPSLTAEMSVPTPVAHSNEAPSQLYSGSTRNVGMTTRRGVTSIAVEPVSIAGMRERLRSITAVALSGLGNGPVLSNQQSNGSGDGHGVGLGVVSEHHPSTDGFDTGNSPKFGAYQLPRGSFDATGGAGGDTRSVSSQGSRGDRFEFGTASSVHSDPLRTGLPPFRRAHTVGSRHSYEYSDFGGSGVRTDGEDAMSALSGGRDSTGYPRRKGASAIRMPVPDEPTSQLHGRKVGRKYDLFEFALSQCELQNVPPGTLLLVSGESRSSVVHSMLQSKKDKQCARCHRAGSFDIEDHIDASGYHDGDDGSGVRPASDSKAEASSSGKRSPQRDPNAPCTCNSDGVEEESRTVQPGDRQMVVLLHGRVNVKVFSGDDSKHMLYANGAGLANLDDNSDLTTAMSPSSGMRHSSSQNDLQALVDGMNLNSNGEGMAVSENGNHRRNSSGGGGTAGRTRSPSLGTDDSTVASQSRRGSSSRTLAQQGLPNLHSSSSLISQGSEHTIVVPQQGTVPQGETVEVDAVAGPVAFGTETLLKNRRHRAQVITSESSFVLKLSVENFKRIVRLAPSIRSDMAALCYIAQPHLLLGCIPCLSLALSNQIPDDRLVIPTPVTNTPHSPSNESDVMRRMRSVAAKKASDATKHAWKLQTALASLFRVIHLQEGEVLFQAGDFGDCCYVVARGKLSVSVRKAGDGSPLLLSCVGRGACIGESALVVPATRTTTVVALEPAVLLRLTHASLSAALTHKSKLWRDVRTAVVWREPFQLIRVPVLRALVGSDAEAFLLAPMSDVFQLTCLSNSGNLPVLQPHPYDSIDEHDPARLPSCFTKQLLCGGEQLGSLMLVASGSVAMECPVDANDSPNISQQPQQLYSAGEWINGSSVLKGLTFPPRSQLVVSGRFKTACVLSVPEAALERFADAIPRGHQRLKVWKMANQPQPMPTPTLMPTTTIVLSSPVVDASNGNTVTMTNITLPQ